VEFGGTDQKFNCLVGRELQQMMGQPPQQVFLVPLLLGTDGSMKMSKSLGNYIAIDEPPYDMYGKVMSIHDDLMMDYFELLTDVSDKELEGFKMELDAKSVNPMELKKRLACEIVAQFHNEEMAQEADEYFERVFQKRELHKEVHIKPISIKASVGSVEVILGRDMPKWLVDNNFANSISEAKRLLAQGAVRIIRADGTRHVVRDDIAQIKLGDVIKVGKRRFVKIVNADKRT
jgi:tyrosyl-tRNA synthetase